LPETARVLLPWVSRRSFLDEAQIRSSHAIMGLDQQLIDDGTYFVIESDGQPAGCGGRHGKPRLSGAFSRWAVKDSNLQPWA